jgi:hypothetical protein
MKVYWESESILQAFVTWALDRDEWSASRPAPLPQGKKPLIPIGWEAGWAAVVKSS